MGMQENDYEDMLVVDELFEVLIILGDQNKENYSGNIDEESIVITVDNLNFCLFFINDVDQVIMFGNMFTLKYQIYSITNMTHDNLTIVIKMMKNRALNGDRVLILANLGMVFF